MASVDHVPATCSGPKELNNVPQADSVEPSNMSRSSKGSVETVRMPAHVVARLVFLACVSGSLFGIDLGSIGAALHGIAHDLELGIIEQGAVVSGVKGGAILGCLIGGAWMAAYGRRNTLAVAAVPFLIGPVVIGFAREFWSALLGRTVMGFGVGVASVAAPCYLSEVAPPDNRGRLVAYYEFALAAGYAVAAVVNYLIELHGACPQGCWRYQSSLLPMMAALPLVLAVYILPESPLWLLKQAGGNAERLREALEAIARLGSPDAKERLALIADAQRAGGTVAPVAPWSDSRDTLVVAWDRQHAAVGSPLLLPAEVAAQRPADVAASAPSVSAARVLIRTVSDVVAVALQFRGVPEGAARGLWLAVLAASLNQFCASTSVMMYAQSLLAQVGVGSRKTQDLMSIAVAVAKVIGVVAGMVVINRVGRRHLLGVGGVTGAITLALVSIGAAERSASVVLLGLCLYILLFVSTWGNGYWVVATEVTAVAGPHYASACQAASTAVLFAAGWLSSLTFLPIMKGGPWMIMLYAGVSVIMAVFAWVLLPETRGHSLEECALAVRGLPVPPRDAAAKV